MLKILLVLYKSTVFFTEKHRYIYEKHKDKVSKRCG